MRRPLTLTAGIIATVTNSILMVMFLISMFSVSFVLSAMPEANISANPILIFLFILLLSFILVSLVLSACSISAWAADFREYKKKNGIIISAAVFNFLLMFYMIIGMALSSEQSALPAGLIVIYSILIVLLLVSNILFLVDIGTERGKMEDFEKPKTYDDISTRPLVAPVEPPIKPAPPKPEPPSDEKK